MSPVEAKKKVLEKWPKADYIWLPVSQKYAIGPGQTEGAKGFLGTGASIDAAWIDAAQRINEEGK